MFIAWFTATQSATAAALTECAEWKLAQRIIAAYAERKSSDIRDEQTNTGKDICDHLAAVPWIKSARVLAPRDLRVVKTGTLGFRAEERQLLVTCEIGGSKQPLKLTFFNEAGKLKFHDIYVEQYKDYLSARDVIGEKVKSLRESARILVADPSQWRDGNKELVNFRIVSTELGLQHVDEVAAFAKAAEDMIVFSTTWRQQTTTTLDQFFSKQDREEKFIKALAEFSAGEDKVRTRSHAGAKLEGGISSVSKTESGGRAEIQNIINELSSAQAGDFKKHFISLNNSHKELLEYLAAFSTR